MTMEQELDELPTPYAVAIRLKASGVDDAIIATALGIDTGSVTALLAIARQKLAHAREESGQTP